MEPTSELVDALYQEEVDFARRMPGGEKLIAGARLFDYACRIMMDGIRNQHPGISDEEVGRIADERLRLARRLERTP